MVRIYHLGLSDWTVRDASEAVVPNGTPDRVEGADGKSYPARRKPSKRRTPHPNERHQPNPRGPLRATQTHRRLGMAIRPDVEAEARARMAEAGAKSAPGKGATFVTPLQPHRAVDEVAGRVGLGSGRTYERGDESPSRTTVRNGAGGGQRRS